MDLWIAGASARPAAFAALRAGLVPGVVDLFADRDLAALTPCERIEPASYPEGLLTASARSPEGPWLYTGGLENAPDVIARISETRPLWGCSPSSIRAVREPIELARFLRCEGFAAAEVARSPEGLPTDGSWLMKPRASSGGYEVAPWLGGAWADGWYLQERIEGASLSAVVLGGASGKDARLVAITRQIQGIPGLPFAYRGNLAPWPVPEPCARRVAALGEALAARFGLEGLFGIDFIDRAGEPWTVEVNPRVTASVEVVELALEIPLLLAHRETCLGASAGSVFAPRPPIRCVAKEIVYAERTLRVEHDLPLPTIGAGSFEVPEVADVPWPGTTFQEREPILTVFSEGHDPDACRTALADRAEHWRRILTGNSDPGEPLAARSVR